ncbi:hypothetical protein BXZ70DRAFT_917198 [Cristinia sonorae]|uniref:Alpha/beta-hydrolase n=1 Tax=Cristinia sonorae TaxID=1940300 RepID=A0A8K0XTT5_9AGAR|nr:hypothetical protein BXZ70DRAFT_917198 [Cristinia sonorae]
MPICPFSTEKEPPESGTHNGSPHLFDDISEKIHETRPRRLDFWAVLFLAVLPVWSVIPLSWAYVVYATYTGLLWRQEWASRILLAVASCEVLFSLYYFCMSHFISGPTPMTPNSLAELQAAYARVLRTGLGLVSNEDVENEHLSRPIRLEEDIEALSPMDPRAIDFRNFLRTWFNRAPWSTIRVENVIIWLYWSIFNEVFTTMEDIPKARRRLLEQTVILLEKRSGLKFPEGFNPDVETLRLTVDPVSTAARPLVWYVVISLANRLVKWRLASRWDVRRGTFQGLDYLLRVPPNWSQSSDQRPIVFLHGLGLGILQYVHFLETLFKAEPDRPFLIPLLPHVSQELFHPRFLRPVGRHESAELIGGLLRELGWVDKEEEDVTSDGESAKLKGDVVKPPKGVTMLSHSNGTFIHCWLLKAHPQMVTRSCFVDPVVFCQWEGDLCYNFCYRSCSTGLELIIKYFVGMELGVAYYIRRHFCWSSNTLWYDEIPNAHDPSKAMFVVGGKDDIVNGPSQAISPSHGVNKGLFYNPNGRHGQPLLTIDKSFGEIVKWLREPTTP